jgi:hypothetical protein
MYLAVPVGADLGRPKPFAAARSIPPSVKAHQLQMNGLLSKYSGTADHEHAGGHVGGPPARRKDSMARTKDRPPRLRLARR